MIYFHERYEAEFGFELAPIWFAVRRATDCAIEPDPRWLMRVVGYLKKHADLRQVPGKISNMITWRARKVELTSMQLHDVASTLYKHHVQVFKSLNAMAP